MAVGDIVLVKSLGGEPLVRRVYQEAKKECLICTEEEFAGWESDAIEPLAVVCPKEKLFKYDNNLFQKLREIAYNQNSAEGELEGIWKVAVLYYG